MNGRFYYTLARNFCRQSPRCTNPSQFKIHFRNSSKTSVHLTRQKKFGKEHKIVYNTDTVDRAENIAFTSSPVLSEKFSLHRKINYEHQILFEKKMSFRTRVAAQNLARVGLGSLNRLTYSLTTRINLGVGSIGNPFSKSRSF